LKQSILEIKHNLSGKLFQSLLLFTINEFSGASTPTREILTFNLCALEVLVFVSETNVTKSDKYDGQFNFTHHTFSNFGGVKLFTVKSTRL
jgi:hypothetical protein